MTATYVRPNGIVRAARRAVCLGAVCASLVIGLGAGAAGAAGPTTVGLPGLVTARLITTASGGSLVVSLAEANEIASVGASKGLGLDSTLDVVLVSTLAVTARLGQLQPSPPPTD